ncbi:MAG: polysaccharide pyruvyl transferase family protein [Flavobacteriales bacterium]
MQKSQYVILTGGKNNAGDFLIKYKAKKLFAALRPDVEIIDFDGWKELTSEQVEVVNHSKALILLGGPALQGSMYPNVFPLVKNLDELKVPVLTMGVGYKEESGHWQNTSSYLFSNATKKLLDRIEKAPFKSSVRDYHTLNVLLHKGYKNFVMSGCPALYELDKIGSNVSSIKSISKIAFSLGVSYLTSSSMKSQMQRLILALASKYGKEAIVVYFHHSIKLDQEGQKAMVDFFEKNQISIEDISGSEKRLVEVYQNCDVHIGYRVHAHIHASSMSIPSILINEDSRGKGFVTVMGGMMLDGYYTLPKFNRSDANLMYKAMGGVKKLSYAVGMGKELEAYQEVVDDVLLNLEYECVHGNPRTKMTRSSIDVHFEEMKKFILQLP